MKILFIEVILLVYFTHFSFAQLNKSSGIFFEKSSTWQEVLEQAKTENKYIFVECFTTWCGPCKLMERDIYPQQIVGKYFSQHFISIKLQMDKTKKDNRQVRDWYVAAEGFQKEYGIPVYPTYLFFSHSGELIYRDEGYKNVDDFLLISDKSVQLGTTVPYKKYYEMLSNYKQGKRDYNDMPDLIDTARLLAQTELEDKISNDYRNHLLLLKETDLYSKKNISFLSFNVHRAQDPFFHMFYPNGNKIDAIMGIKGYASVIVDDIIQKEEIDPILVRQGDKMNDTGNLKLNSDPEWKDILIAIKNKYSKDYAERNILKTQIKWYQDHHQWNKCSQFLTLMESKYSMESNDGNADMNFMVTIWWAIFDRSVDKDQIDIAIKTMKKMIQRVFDRGDPPFCFLDTYANLLYKAGQLNEAFVQEELAVEETIKWKQPESLIKEYKSTLAKMKAGLPTWPRYIDKDDIFGDGLI